MFQVQTLSSVLAKALACPRAPAGWSCPSYLVPSSFHCMFINKAASSHCQVKPGHFQAMPNSIAFLWHIKTMNVPKVPNAVACAQDPLVCHNDSTCYSHLLRDSNIRIMESAEAAVAEAMSAPMTVDAVITLSAAGGPGPYSAHSRHRFTQQGRPLHSASGPQWSYTIRMNHTDVPPTPLLLDLFDVSPTQSNGLGYYRDYWFFTNLQV